MNDKTTTTNDPDRREIEKMRADMRAVTNWGYHGDTDLCRAANPTGQWVIGLSVNRDSDMLEESNWAVISKHMEKNYPDMVTIERFNHWACGWIDHLMVRVLDDADQVTEAARALLEWKRKLANYPVASDDDLSNREVESQWEQLEGEVKYLARREGLTLVTFEDTTQAIMEYMRREMPEAFEHEMGCVDFDNIEEAMIDLGIIDESWDE